MALIRCPECSLEVSEQAATCPKCGYPINRHSTAHAYSNQNIDRGNINTEPRAEEDGNKGLIGFILAIVSLLLPIAYVDLMIGVVAFVLSLMGTIRGEKHKGLAIAGIIISIISVLGGLVLLSEHPEFYMF